jgi:alpha-L-rhamnosidase
MFSPVFFFNGVVSSGQSVFLEYKGEQLRPMAKYWWKVRVWNQEDRFSDWSEPQFFKMGVMDEANWQGAQWMQLAGDTRTSEHKFREVQNERMPEPVSKTSFPAGYFRKEFDASKPLKNAELYICGLGYYEAFLNGKKIGDHVLDPSPTSYDHHALYVVH